MHIPSPRRYGWQKSSIIEGHKALLETAYVLPNHVYISAYGMKNRKTNPNAWYCACMDRSSMRHTTLQNDWTAVVVAFGSIEVRNRRIEATK